MRDKLFSLYGLLPHSNIDRSLITPSYDLTVEHLFSRLAADIAQASRSLDILSAKNCWHPSLPSWVPDWTACNKINKAEQTDVIRPGSIGLGQFTDYGAQGQ